MLVHKAALLASVLLGIGGATQAEAACFGTRNCCHSAPVVVCPPCQTPAPHVVTPVCDSCGTGGAGGGLNAAQYGIQLGPGETLLTPPRAVARTYVGDDDLVGRLQAIEDMLEKIKEKTDKLP